MPSIKALLTAILLSGLFMSVGQVRAAEPAKTASSPTEQSFADFRRQMEADLDKLKVQIDQLRIKAAHTSGQVKEKVEKEASDLDAQRAQLKRRLGETSQSTGRAWDQMRAGLSKAMGELQSGFDKARGEFQSAEKSPKSAASEDSASASKNKPVKK